MQEGRCCNARAASNMRLAWIGLLKNSQRIDTTPASIELVHAVVLEPHSWLAAGSDPTNRCDVGGGECESAGLLHATLAAAYLPNIGGHVPRVLETRSGTVGCAEVAQMTHVRCP